MKFFDRVKETSISIGTGNFTLAGAISGFRTFASVLSTNDTCYYCITMGNEWEVGIGTYSATNTLTRTTVLASSNSGNAVNFSSGTKEVFLTVASNMMDAGCIEASLTEPANPVDGKLWLDLNDEASQITMADGNLVEKKVIPADCSSVTFSGLDSLVDGDYILQGTLVNNNGATVDYTIIPNGQSLSSMYNCGIIMSNSDSGPAKDSAQRDFLCTTALGVSFLINISLSGTGHVLTRTNASRRVNDTNTTWVSKSGQSITTISNITSITVNGVLASDHNTVATNCIKAGSIFRLYKTNASQNLVSYTPLDVTNRTSDYPMKQGETVYRTFTNATSVPLNIATEEGVYEIELLSNYIVPGVSTGSNGFQLNNSGSNSIYSAWCFMDEAYNSGDNTEGITSWRSGTNTFLNIGEGYIVGAKFTCRTRTLGKTISYNSIGIYSASNLARTLFNGQAIWKDTTTHWESLGTFAFAQAHSGTIIIKRII